MVLITSIMNNGIEEDLRNQKNAICTWRTLGIKVLSVNTEDEITALEDKFPEVQFIQLKRTGLERYGKAVPYIYDMMEILYHYCEDDDEICGIINSDIYLKNISDVYGLTDLFLKNDFKLIGLHRYDVENAEELDGQYYFSGIDVFCLKRKYLTLFKDEGFALGRPEWDHWVIYTAVNHGMEYIEVKDAVAYHVRHKQRWKASESNALGAGAGTKSSNCGEEYYYKTNCILQDITGRISLADKNKSEPCVWEEIAGLYVEKDVCNVAWMEMKRHNSDAVRFPLGIGYKKGDKFYRVCVAHRNIYWKNEMIVRKKAANIDAVIPKAGEVIGYIDFMQTELAGKLGRFYIYSAGRAGKAMADGLLYHELCPLGFVDRDPNMQGLKYLDIPIFGLDVLEKKETYDNVLIISNLYIDEIYQELSEIVPIERLIII